jgi:hypothetical protein
LSWEAPISFLSIQSLLITKDSFVDLGFQTQNHALLLCYAPISDKISI